MKTEPFHFFNQKYDDKPYHLSLLNTTRKKDPVIDLDGKKRSYIWEDMT